MKPESADPTPPAGAEPSPEARKAARRKRKGKRYYQAHKVEINARISAWRKVNRIKTKAYVSVRVAIANGSLVALKNCQRCNSDKFVHAHHADYSKPLQVEWLCRKCHFAEHDKPKFFSTVQKRFKGDKCPTAKLTEESAKEIIALFNTGKFSKCGLGRKFNINEKTIRLLLKGTTWNHLKK